MVQIVLDAILRVGIIGDGLAVVVLLVEFCLHGFLSLLELRLGESELGNTLHLGQSLAQSLSLLARFRQDLCGLSLTGA